MFPSEIVRAPLFNKSIHHLTHKRRFLHQPTQHTPKMRSVGEHFCRNDRTVIPCTLCEHLRVSPSNISFRHSRNFSSKSPKYSADRCGALCSLKPRACLCERVFGEPLKIYHGLSFCFLWSLYFLFLSRKKKRKKVTNIFNIK